MKILSVNVEKYGYVLPDLTPPVMIETYFSPAFCDKILEVAALSTMFQSGVYNSDLSEGVNVYHRSSKACHVPFPVYSEMVRALERMMAYLVLPQTNFSSIKISEAVQFLQYDDVSNGHFKAHTDNAYFDSEGKFIYTNPNRTFTSILYLNDDYEGGQLVLNSVLGDDDHPIVLKPSKGQVVIFPADIRFTHEVLPVTKGKRYSIVGWYKAQ